MYKDFARTERIPQPTIGLKHTHIITYTFIQTKSYKLYAQVTYSCLLARINIFTCAFSFAHAEECSMLSCRKKACIKMSKSNMGADNDRISEPFFFLSFFTRENFPIRAVVNTSGTSFADRIVMAVQPVDHTPTNIADDIKNK